MLSLNLSVSTSYICFLILPSTNILDLKILSLRKMFHLYKPWPYVIESTV